MKILEVTAGLTYKKKYHLVMTEDQSAQCGIEKY